MRRARSRVAIADGTRVRVWNGARGSALSGRGGTETIHHPAPVRNFSLPKKKEGLQRKEFGGRSGFLSFSRVLASTTGLESLCGKDFLSVVAVYGLFLPSLSLSSTSTLVREPRFSTPYSLRFSHRTQGKWPFRGICLQHGRFSLCHLGKLGHT